MKKSETINICGSGTFPKGNPCHVPNTNYDFSVSNPGRAVGHPSGGWTISSNHPTNFTPQSFNPYIPNQHIQNSIGNSSGSQSSGNENHNGSGYSLTAIQNLPRIATDTEFAATCHGNIAVESIVHHAVQQNSTGKGINAIASLQMINLSYNKLNDNDLCNLNNGLLGYTLNLKVFNLSYNNFGDAGIDYLIKGLAGVQYLQAGGRELSSVMKGLFTHYNVNITTINLSNNHIGDIGAAIISNAIVTNSLHHVKALNLADNNITDTGAVYLADSFKSEGNKLNVLHLEGNKLTPDGEFRIGSSIKTVVQDMIVFVKKFTGKEIIKPALKEFVKYAEKYGVDTTHIATNKPTLDYIKDTGIIIKNIAFGYAKCSNIVIDMLTFDTTLPSLAKSTTIEMYGSKAVKKADLKVCVTWETHDAIVSPEGVDLAVKAIDLLGDGE